MMSENNDVRTLEAQAEPMDRVLQVEDQLKLQTEYVTVQMLQGRSRELSLSVQNAQLTHELAQRQLLDVQRELHAASERLTSLNQQLKEKYNIGEDERIADSGKIVKR